MTVTIVYSLELYFGNVLCRKLTVKVTNTSLPQN